MEHAAYRPQVRRTIVRSIKAAWETLGFTCAASLTLFVGCAPIALATVLPSPLGLLAGMAAYALVLAPLIAGVGRLTHRILERDEPSFLDVVRGAGAMYRRAAGLGIVQALVAAAITADAVVLARFGTPGAVGGVVMAYLLVFWCMACVYHWPLLVAADEGLLRRDDGARSGLAAILRNGFVMTLSAPGFTFAMLVAMLVVLPILAATGIGLALLGGGFCGHLTMRAAREQYVRFGLMEPAPDLDEPAGEETWRLR